MSLPSHGPRPWSAGAIIGGRYRVLDLIGAGAMGEVWRAEHLSLGTHIALKLIDASARGHAAETLARFHREARAAAQLKSPNVVQTLDHGTEGSIAYIAMELLEGESLGERITRTHVLSPADTAWIITDMARAIGRAHELGIIHRDLKPENVFLARGEGRDMAKILDFGIAKIATASPDSLVQTREGMMVGTPAYMSPEQVLGNAAIDWRSDLWQMGVIAFECICGHRPFEAHALGELFMKICSGPIAVPSSIARVPDGFDAWFARASQRAPGDRFTSASELATTLAAVLVPGAPPELSVRIPAATPVSLITGNPVVGPPMGSVALRSAREAEPPPSALPRQARRAAVIGALVAVPVSLAVVIAALLLARGQGEPQAAPPAPAAALTAAAPEIPAPSVATATAAPAPSIGPDAGIPVPPSPTERRRPERPEDVLGI